MNEEIQALIDVYKADRPEVDWDVEAVYVITNPETGEVVRMGHAKRDRILVNFSGQVVE